MHTRTQNYTKEMLMVKYVVKYTYKHVFVIYLHTLKSSIGTYTSWSRLAFVIFTFSLRNE